MKHFAMCIIILSTVTALDRIAFPPIGGRSCHVDADCRRGETCQQRDVVWQCVETKGSEP